MGSRGQNNHYNDENIITKLSVKQRSLMSVIFFENDSIGKPDSGLGNNCCRQNKLGGYLLAS